MGKMHPFPRAALTNHDKLDGFKTTETYSQTALQARSQQSSCPWCEFPSRSAERKKSSWTAGPGGLWSHPSSLSLFFHIVSLPLLCQLSLCLSLLRSLPLDLNPTQIIQDDCTSTPLTSSHLGRLSQWAGRNVAWTYTLRGPPFYLLQQVAEVLAEVKCSLCHRIFQCL